MPAHVHAELMAQYAQDAMETDTPWKRWEFYDETEAVSNWSSLTGQPGWNISLRYRRKPCTVKIHGFDVPEPCKVALQHDSPYYVPDLFNKASSTELIWKNDDTDKVYLQKGLVHLTQQAAELHAQALLSFTQKVPDA